MGAYLETWLVPKQPVLKYYHSEERVLYNFSSNVYFCLGMKMVATNGIIWTLLFIQGKLLFTFIAFIT